MAEVTYQQVEGTAPPPVESETAPAPVSVAPDTTPETPETDEQVNERVQREAAEVQQKKARGVQKRIDELTADKHAERAARQAAEQTNAQLLAFLQGKTPAGNTPQPRDGEPTKEQFTDYQDYLTAFAEYRAVKKAEEFLDKRTREADARNAQAQTQQQARQVQEKFQGRVAEFAKVTPDFAQVVAENSEVRIPDEASALVQLMEDGPAILYQLGKNPETAQRLWNQPPHVQAIMLGRISASLQSVPAVSNAPPPGKPVGAKSGPSSEPPQDMAGYLAWRKKARG